MLNIRNWIIIFFIPLFCLSGFAQTPPPTPTPSQRVGGTDWERKSEVQRKQDDDAWLASKKVEISTVSSPAASKPPSGLDFAKATTAMSPTAAQMKILAPSNDDLALDPPTRQKTPSCLQRQYKKSQRCDALLMETAWAIGNYSNSGGG